MLWLHSMELVWGSGMPTMQSLFFNAVFALVIVAMLNLALRRWLPTLALTPGELAVVYGMITLASAVGGHDFMQVLALQLPTHAYFATPENNWNEIFAELLDSPLTVTDPGAVRNFWETGVGLYRWDELSAWLPSIGIWSIFVLGLMAAMLLLDALVWRRWTDQEKLTYPLTEIPFRLTEPGFEILGKDLMGNRLFWVGFIIAGGLDIYNGISVLRPGWPTIPLTAINIGQQITSEPWRAMGNTWVSVYPFAIGLGYLMPQDFLFSAWFFYWFWKAELVSAAALGFRQTGFPYVSEQTFGAYAGLAIFSLWTGRHYFSRLIGEVLRGQTPADEARQAAPYRLLLGGFVAAIAVVIGFITQALGVSLLATAIWLIGYLLMSLAITRMRAEFGLPVHDLFTGPMLMMVSIGGSGAFRRQDLIGLGQLAWLERIQRSHPMPHGIESLGLGERRGVRGGSMLTGLCIATVIGAAAAFWAAIHLGYESGFVTRSSDAPYLAMGAASRPASWVRSATSPDLRRAVALGVGGAFTIGLLLLRQRYIWWPFHPAGFAASSIWFIGLLWVPLFVAWLVKGTVLRYGGHRLYIYLLPLFLGLTLGEFVVGSVWGLIGTIWRIPTYRFWAY